MQRHRSSFACALIATALAISCKAKRSVQPEIASAPSASADARDASAPKPDLAARANELAHRFIIVDGHIDVPWRLEESRDDNGKLTEDVSAHTPKGDFDWERAVQGGLTAPFMSIYVPAD